MENAEDWFVPAVLFIVIGAVFALSYYFRFRSRAEMQLTVRVALERGQELSAEIVDRLGEAKRTPFHDLRRGVIAIGVAVGFGVFGVVLGEEDATRPLLAISSMPLMIGIAYLFLWAIARGRNEP